LPDAKICSSSQKPHEISGSLTVSFFVLLRQKTLFIAPLFLRFPSLQGKKIHSFIAITSFNQWFLRKKLIDLSLRIQLPFYGLRGMKGSTICACRVVHLPHADRVSTIAFSIG